MKIVLYMDNPVIPTGYASTCRLTAQEFIKRGHEVYAMAFNGGPLPDKVAEWNGIKIFPNDALKRDKNAIYGDMATLIRVENEVKPDIHFFHNDSYRYSYVQNAPREILEKSVFWLPFEGEQPDVVGVKLFDRMAATRFVTKHALNIHAEQLKGKDVGYIPHAVDMYHLGPCPDKAKAKQAKQLGIENKFVVCRIDRHQPRKYWEQTLRAFAKFAEGKDDVFLIAKCDPRDITMWNHEKKEGVDLEAVAKNLGITDKVKFDNFFFDDSYMAQAFHHPADVFLTTTSGEGFGLTPAGAMACGVPVIYPKTPVLPEVVGDAGIEFPISGRTYFEPMHVWHNIPDIDAAAEKLEWAYSDWKNNGSKELQKISEKALKVAKEKYSPKAVYDQWNEVFESLKEKGDLVSIITVIYNLAGEEQIYGPDGVEKFHQSLKDNVSTPYEWIVVDNGSPQSEITRSWLSQAAASNRRIRPVLLDVNKGFAGAHNVAIAMARGKYIVLSNPDSEALSTIKQNVPHDYLKSMTNIAKADPKVGIVGMDLRERPDILPNSKFPYFCCALLTRECLDAIKIGEEKWFDEKFWPAYYEDQDVCLRAEGKGFKIVPNSFIPFYHKSGGTNKFAIEGGAGGPYTGPLAEAIEKLSKTHPDMADWDRKRAELKAEGMGGLIRGNIEYLNKKWGMEARSKVKIVWETRIGDGVGFSQIVEGLAPELEKVGFDVYVHDWSNASNVEDPRVRKMIEKYDKANMAGELTDAIYIVSWLMETFLQCDGNYKIGISLCESTKVRESYLQACNNMDRILTFSQFCKGVQIDSGFKVPIDVIPPGVHPIFHNYHRRPDPKPEDPIKFRFLNVGVAQGRKDTVRLVQAFAEAFPKNRETCPDTEPNFPLRPREVELILKSNNFGELNWVEPYKQMANIRTIFTGEDARASRKNFSMQEMYDLYCEADSYIHMSHGEGIGLPILESAATGLPVLFVNWSSPAEYLNESNSYPISLSPYPGTTFTQAYPGAPGDNGVWCNPHIGHAKHLMYHVIRNREEAREKGKVASDHMAKNYNWENTARLMIPLIFEWDKENKAKTKMTDFNPLTFRKPEIKPVNEGDRVLVDICTRDRHQYLCSLVTSLLCQTFKQWDILIQCDDADESMPNDYHVMSLMYRCQHEGHGWRIIRSHRQGPHIAHDRTLQMAADDPNYKYKLVCRIDDDIVLTPDFLKNLYDEFRKDKECSLGAVAGVLLDPKRPDKEQMAPSGYEKDLNYAGKIEPNWPWPYVCRYPPGTKPREVEHLYSSFMYRVEVATAIGGYCRKYSQIGHREESDFSYRFHLAGYRLLVQPESVGYHFCAPSGGIRSDSIGHNDSRHQLAMHDDQIYQARLAKWKEQAEQRRLKAPSGSAKPPPSPAIKKGKVALVVNGAKDLCSIRSAVGKARAIAEEVYVTCEIDEAKGLEGVAMVATTPDEAAMLTRALASDGDHEFVMTVSDTMRFEGGNPKDLLCDDYDDYVFECYKTYLPGRTMKDVGGNPVFVQDETVGETIGPETRNQCLAYRRRAEKTKPEAGRIYYASSVIVVDDVRIPPVNGKSLMGNDLVPLENVDRMQWTKICIYQYPEGNLNPPKMKEVLPSKNTTISILIPTYGRLQHLRRCISSIYSMTSTPFEIIVVDNGSSDGTAEYLAKESKLYKNLRVLTQKVNLGYQKAINLAASVAKGEYLLFFNDDAWVQGRMPDGRDWLRTLMDELSSDPKLGLVGPHGGKSPALGIDMLYFWCVMIRSSLFKEIGPMDDLTFNNYGGDDDYCMRLKQAGYSVGIKHGFEGKLRHLMNLEPPDKISPELEASRKRLVAKWEKIAATP